MSIAALLGTSSEIPATNSPHNWRLRLVWLQGDLMKKQGLDPSQSYEQAAAQCREEYRNAIGQEPPADLLPPMEAAAA